MGTLILKSVGFVGPELYYSAIGIFCEHRRKAKWVQRRTACRQVLRASAGAQLKIGSAREGGGGVDETSTPAKWSCF